MSLFDSFKKKQQPEEPEPIAPAASKTVTVEDTSLAKLALNSIQEGFIISDSQNHIKMINPEALTVLGLSDETLALGFDLPLCMQFEDQNGKAIPEDQNPFFHAVTVNQPFKARDLVLVAKDSGTRTAVEISVIPTDGQASDRIINFRDINKELETESEQSEFISTASHEMRTPVASIEGYLSLALNPQTATIDARAKKYLEAAQQSSTHLGHLFKNLLDVTKLDDRKIQPKLIPIKLTDFIKQIADGFAPQFEAKHIAYTFGSKKSNQGMKIMHQPVYTFVDTSFLQESVSNLIENAIKYTPEHGRIWVNVEGDEEKAYVSIADSGIGILSEDLEHIFQKFYRSDNSQTREIGGTGLGLYIVKQRIETMGGNVWAKSVYGRGSTFTISLPRLSLEEYNKRRITLMNEIQAQAATREKQLQAAMAAAKSPTQQLAPSQVLTQPVDQPPVQPPNPVPPAQPLNSPLPVQPQAPVPSPQPTPQIPQNPVQQPTQNQENMIR